MGFRWCWHTHLPRRSRCPDLERVRVAEHRRRRCLVWLERGLRAPARRADAPGSPGRLGTEPRSVAAGAASSPPLSAARSWPAGTSGFLWRLGFLSSWPAGTSGFSPRLDFPSGVLPCLGFFSSWPAGTSGISPCLDFSSVAAGRRHLHLHCRRSRSSTRCCRYWRPPAQPAPVPYNRRLPFLP